MSEFEDPTQLARCIKSDCQRYRMDKNTPLCAAHLREQEQGAAGYVEPDVEARVARVRTEDDDHPGMVKVYDKETGKASWVPKEPAMTYVLMDPDVNGGAPVPRDALGVPFHPDDPALRPDPAKLEPHWVGGQWVLREKPADPARGYPQKIARIESLVRELMSELGIVEWERDD